MRRVCAAGAALACLAMSATGADAADGTGTDIAVTMVTSQPRIRVHDEATVIVTAANLGPAPATDVVVATPLPVGLTLVSSDASLGHHDAERTSWGIGSLAVGQTATLTLLVRAESRGQAAYPAGLVASSPMDGNQLNNMDSAPMEVLPALSDEVADATEEKADLQVTTNVVPDVAEPGGIVTSTVTVTNLGPTETSTVEVVGLASPGADILDAWSTAAFDRERRVWTVGSLGPGQFSSLVLRQRVPRPGSTINTALIIRAGLPDPNLGNNTARGVVHEASADVVVLARADVARVGVGGTVVYMIVATNLGPSASHGVSVISLLDSQLSLVDATATVGSYDSDTGVWSIGELAPGEIQNLRIEAIAGWPSDVVIRAVITSTSPAEPRQGNNSADSRFAIVASPEQTRADPGGPAALGDLGWWLTSSGAIGLLFVLAGAALMLARRRDPLSDL